MATRKYEQAPLLDVPVVAKQERRYWAEIWRDKFPSGRQCTTSLDVDAETPEFAAELVWTMMTKETPARMGVCDVVVLTDQETQETVALECDFTHWTWVELPEERTR